MCKPFPYVFIRYASLHYSTFKSLQLHGITRFLQIQQYITKKLSDLREPLCVALYEAISQQSEDDVRRQLIKLKRDIYNNKPLTAEPGIEAALPEVLIENLQLYCRFQHKLQELTSSWEQYYSTSVYRHRQFLQQLAGDELLKQGLLLSSQSLYEQLFSFLSRDPASFRHKEQKNEYGLLRYLTRMAFKTSPFSTFTSTGLAETDAEITDMHIQPLESVRSNTRLNNSLFTYIRSLLLHHSQLNNMLLISLNSTVVVKNDTIHFLVNWLNIESFQKMPATDIVKWIVDFLQKQREISLALLTTQIATITNVSDTTQVKDFILRLIAAGLLDAGTGTSGIHPEWDDQLCKFLETQLMQYPSVEALHTMLRHLREARFKYNGLKATERNQLLQQAADLLNNTMDVLHNEVGIKQVSEKDAVEQQLAYLRQLQSGHFVMPPFIPRRFSPSAIFFEDTSVGTKQLLPRQSLQDFTASVYELCSVLSLLDPLQPERDNMRNFFLKYYGAHASVPVTDFYHAYFLHEKKQIQHQQQQQHATKQLPDHIQQLLLERLHISPGNDERGNIIVVNLSGKTHIATSQPCSMGMFVQFFGEGSSLKGVINHLLPGMGKVAGRFLHMFDEQVTGEFNKWNQSLYEDCVLMELSDGSGFNANIHPPLLPWELRMPGGQNNYTFSQQVSLQDLHVQCDADNSALYLWHIKWQKKVYAFDLSLESLFRRSNFYQLLAHFNTEHRIMLRKFNNWIDGLTGDEVAMPENKVIHKARIVFGNNVIVRRAGWVVPIHLIPIQQNNETEAAWFTRLNVWRQALNIPKQFFLYLRSPYIPLKEKTEKLRDDHKPQYIDFGSPLLASVFKKMVARSEQVYFEEMLPGISDLENCTDQRPVTEFLIHWYSIQ